VALLAVGGVFLAARDFLLADKVLTGVELEGLIDEGEASGLHILGSGVARRRSGSGARVGLFLLRCSSRTSVNSVEASISNK
jgi:hypothetical protein